MIGIHRIERIKLPIALTYQERAKIKKIIMIRARIIGFVITVCKAAAGDFYLRRANE